MGTFNAEIASVLKSQGGQFGADGNAMSISNGGVATFAGTAKRSLIMRPVFSTGYQKTTAKPAELVRSSVIGYIMPVYNADNQEMFFRDVVPGRWDGTSNSTFYIVGYIDNAGGETVGKKFKLQVSVEATDGVTGICDASPVDADSGDVLITTDHSAQFSWYTVPIVIPASTLVAARELIHWRVRRIASSATAIAGNFVITNWYCKYVVDKIYSA
jgi:hypothetical protein